MNKLLTPTLLTALALCVPAQAQDGALTGTTVILESTIDGMVATQGPFSDGYTQYATTGAWFQNHMQEVHRILHLRGGAWVQDGVRCNAGQDCQVARQQRMAGYGHGVVYLIIGMDQRGIYAEEPLVLNTDPWLGTEAMRIALGEVCGPQFGGFGSSWPYVHRPAFYASLRFPPPIEVLKDLDKLTPHGQILEHERKEPEERDRKRKEQQKTPPPPKKKH